jgi:integrase/recombinase XerD
LALVDPFPAGRERPLLTGLVPLDRTSSLALARTWYRRELEQAGRPRNTVESYSYDLQTLETMIGPKPLHRIDRTDIARFLGEAETRSTRKRRLTTARRFFRYLIDDARVVSIDPTEGFFPHQITLRLPMPLFATEQAQLMEAADLDEPWSGPAIHLMMRLGLTRGELLGLSIDHIDHSVPAQPVVFVGFESTAKRGRERRMAGDAELASRLSRYQAEVEPTDRLFPFGPPAVNAMVDRVRKRAGIGRTVTPQTLRHTYAVEQARAGADTERLLDLLGLVDDPRNRSSVSRYLKLAEPPLG